MPIPTGDPVGRALSWSLSTFFITLSSSFPKFANLKYPTKGSALERHFGENSSPTLQAILQIRLKSKWIYGKDTRRCRAGLPSRLFQNKHSSLWQELLTQPLHGRSFSYTSLISQVVKKERRNNPFPPCRCITAASMAGGEWDRVLPRGLAAPTVGPLLSLGAELCGVLGENGCISTMELMP